MAPNPEDSISAGVDPDFANPVFQGDPSVADYAYQNFNSPTAAVEGAGPLSGAVGALTQMNNGDWGGAAVEVLGLGLDALGIVMNPLKGLATAGIGWLIEHVGFLKEGLDLLAGDPEAVANKAQTWTNIANHLTQSAQNLDASLEGITGTEGPAVATYRETVRGYIDAVAVAAEHAHTASRGTNTAGTAVGVTRGLVREMISEWVFKTGMKWLAASATAPVSGGTTVAAFTADSVYSGAQLSTRITRSLRELTDSLDSLGKGAGESAAAFKQASRSFNKFMNEGAGGMKTASHANKAKRLRRSDSHSKSNAAANKADNVSDGTKAASHADQPLPFKDRVENFKKDSGEFTRKDWDTRISEHPRVASTHPKLAKRDAEIERLRQEHPGSPEWHKARADRPNLKDDADKAFDKAKQDVGDEFDKELKALAGEQQAIRGRLATESVIEHSATVAKEASVNSVNEDDRARKAEQDWQENSGERPAEPRQQTDGQNTGGQSSPTPQKWRAEGTLD